MHFSPTDHVDLCLPQKRDLCYAPADSGFFNLLEKDFRFNFFHCYFGEGFWIFKLPLEIK